MTVLTSVLLGILAMAGGLSLARLLRGGSLADRIVALDTLLVIIVCGLAVQAIRDGNGVYLDAMVVAALLGFIGTGLVAGYIERRGSP